MSACWHGIKAGLTTALGCCVTSLVLAAPGAHGPNGEHLDSPKTASVGGLARLPDGRVNVPKPAQRRMAIRTQVVTVVEQPKAVRLNGVVAIDSNAGGVVQAPFAGAVVAGEDGFPVLGQLVQKGQKLARIRPLTDGISLSQQQTRLADLQANLKLAEQTLARYEQLRDTTPRKDLDATRLQVQLLRSQIQTLRQSVSVGHWLVSPAKGVVASAHALNGQVVQAGQEIFQIIDPMRLNVVAQVAKPELATQIVSGFVEGKPGVVLTLQGAARTVVNGQVPVRFDARSIRADQPIDLLVDQPVSVAAQLRETIRGVVLPASALVRSQNNEFAVWVKVTAERFMTVPVEHTALNANQIVVTRGLDPDQRVVVQGGTLIGQIR